MQQIRFLGAQQATAAVRGERPALSVFAHHFRVDGEGVHVDVGHDGIEVHTGAVFWQFHSDDALGLAVFEQAIGEELNALRRGAFRHAD